MSILSFETKPEKGTAQILQLHRAMDVELVHLFLGQSLKRIRAFAERYDTDADPMVMTREFERDFAQDKNHEFFLVVAIRELKVIGHFLSRAEFYYGRKWVYILQLDIFGALLTTDEVESGMRMLRNWQFSIGANGIRGGALTDAHARLYRRYGFKPKWMLLEDS